KSSIWYYLNMIPEPNKDKKLLKRIAQKYSLELLLLFGSQVTGKTHQESDFDIAYLSRKILSIEQEGELMIGLAPLLKISLEKMELVSLKNLSPLFFKEIFSNAMVIFAKDETIFDRYKIYAFRLFEESVPIFEQTEKILKKRIADHKKELSLK
ncbi:MAG: nucleotidyltransferase domain-containing protein, partial [bacterium]|nr:nucleotidyltransferase domain-containing protein [bacterium]